MTLVRRRQSKEWRGRRCRKYWSKIEGRGKRKNMKEKKEKWNVKKKDEVENEEVY